MRNGSREIFIVLIFFFVITGILTSCFNEVPQNNNSAFPSEVSLSAILEKTTISDLKITVYGVSVCRQVFLKKRLEPIHITL